VRWHKLGEVENECTSHNFIVLAIFLPKIIKVNGNLTKFWRKQFWLVFLRHGVVRNLSLLFLFGLMLEWRENYSTMSLLVWQNFTCPSFDDRVLEVVAVFNSVQLGMSRVFNPQHHRIAQVRTLLVKRLRWSRFRITLVSNTLSQSLLLYQNLIWLLSRSVVALLIFTEIS